jgi:hypothetical protein
MSNDSFMKTRSAGALGTPRLGDQGRRRQEANKRAGGGRKFADGQFERFFPGETPIWINISPYSYYEQEIWDRQQKEVVKTATTWYEYQKHYVPRNKGKTVNGKRVDTDFVCSCGPYRKQPCWGCAIRTNHYDMLAEIEKEKGFRPDKDAPISRMSNFALAITVMEKIYAIPLRNNDGTIRKARSNGQIIYRYMPAPIADARDDIEESELANFTYQFGHRMHWSMGPEELQVLTEADDKMKNYCADCADKLIATHMICPGCETKVDLGKEVSDVDLMMVRNKVRTCTACGEKGPFEPDLMCPGCGGHGPQIAGRLTSFDIRLTRKKLSDKKYQTEIVAIRIPGVPGNQADHDRAMDLIQNPLNLAAIYAPTSLDSQKFICGDMTKGLKPDLAVVKDDDEEAPSDTESYGEGGDGSGDDGDGNRSIQF